MGLLKPERGKAYVTAKREDGIGSDRQSGLVDGVEEWVGLEHVQDRMVTARAALALVFSIAPTQISANIN